METIIKTINETQRIAKCLDISNIDDSSLCVKVQGKIKEILKENEKLKFTNTMMNEQVKNKNNELKLLKSKYTDFEYIDKIKEQFDSLYKTLKKENTELNSVIIELKKENDYYKKRIKQLI